MSWDYIKTTPCQERLKDPLEMFHSGHLVKICAPMVRYSKLAFRTLVRKYNCDLCYTPMIVAADFVRSIKARDSEFTTNKGDCPLIVQFAANDAQLLSDAAQIVCPYANGIDINCGCPQRWAITEGYGACLINKPELVQDMVKQVRSQVENPNFSVSIKIRIHDDLTRTVDLCRKAEATGVSWITVHGRNIEERHQPVHYDAIKIIKENLSIPIIANGDIKSLKEAENVQEMTGTDGKKSIPKLGKKDMTLQWAAVATFLYAEIGLILALCLPFIPPQRWQKIFMFPLWGKIATYWNKAFLTIIVLLIVLFLDAVREVKKYSISHGLEKSSSNNPSAYEHVQMKLFRAQRNLYISGFSLFLWLVLRRLVTLITQLSKELGIKGVLKIQADSNNDAAKKYMEENERLKQVLEKTGKGDEQKLDAENKNLVESVEKLKAELMKTSDALSKVQNEAVTMKKQSESLSKEYDRLLKEHTQLQEILAKSEKKKDL
ncbi:tRNA-dihydrouridine(20a/20b) synthase [NAD(P)+]-like isoform X1 [Gracilinanus agilis]|uniref:tRNA-dihydrouridine(20a/20b) synthase [NAD(P)+]-like isoform X1 n=2 Tax=Gracilinanus agilis TaxID=191870 RepID=UPI001CFE45CF|nr:tRNA-dihydrouridine(20a/20b) synthase [NAD(P)+]-like isoform X1 [Gracilinanus agilis]